jgi:cytochrome c
VSVHEAKIIAEYMLNVNDKRLSELPLQGTYTPAIPEGDNGRGSVVVRAVYSDNGAGEYPALTSESMTILRSPKLGPQSADVQHEVTAGPTRGAAGAILPKHGSHIGFKRIDLTGIRSIELVAQAQARGGHAGGTIEIRTGSPTGPIIGRHELSLGGAQGPTATQVQEAGGAAAGGGQGRGGRGGRGSGGGTIVPIKPAAGVQDLYFVFRNDKALAAQPLMTLSTITLNNE